MIEDQVRSALRDPGLGLPVPPDPVAWVHQRVRRQRRLAVAASSLVTVLVVALAALLVPTAATSPVPVASALLDWPARGELGRDPQVRADLQTAWDGAGEVFRTRALVPPPARSGSLTVLWAGAPVPGGSERGPRRAALVQAQTAAGGAVASALDRGEGWVLEAWGELPADGVQALVLPLGPVEPLPFGPIARDEVHVLTAPGAGVTTVLSAGTVAAAPERDGLTGPFVVQRVLGRGSEERFAVRVGDAVLAPPCGPGAGTGVGSGAVGPLLAPVDVRVAEPVAGWAPLGPPPGDAELFEDALRVVAEGCAPAASAAPLWRGTLPSGDPARVVALARPGTDPVAALVTSRQGPPVLAAGTATGPVVLLVQGVGVDTLDLVAVGSEQVARIELVGAEPASAEGRVLVHRSEYGGASRSTLVAYDAAGRELLRRPVASRDWLPAG